MISALLNKEDLIEASKVICFFFVEQMIFFCLLPSYALAKKLLTAFVAD